MNYLSLTSLSLSTLLLTACASQTGWQPTVDTFNDPNAYRLNQDMAECQELAKHASGGTVKETLVGAGGGGRMGAAAGAVGGAIAGNAGTGAAIGAAIGGLGGAAKQGLTAEDKYKHAYNNCMSGRGHRVIR